MDNKSTQPVRRDVLDHGYIDLVESWGSDERIIEAARMSTGKGFLGWGPKACKLCGDEPGIGGYLNYPCPKNPDEAGNWGSHQFEPGDEKLLRYLYQNNHSTPFEMGGLIIEVQAPIFVFREWHRHRTQSYNEMSARYTPLPDLNYVPTVERLLLNSKTNKQAGIVKGATCLDDFVAERYRERLRAAYEADQHLYEAALSMGVPKELARVHLPVGRYSRMRASANLRNWLAFLTLRQAPNAQWEIRQYADAVGKIVQCIFPRTWELFAERQEATHV